MAGTIVEDYGMGGVPSSTEGMSSEQHCHSGDSIAEWRSCEQVENGIPSTSPPYWDTDDDDDGGPKPSELYGRYTWKIENFSKINKRELRSDAFEVGGYKWYILIYPQGCDVCNHLSLFLCVANHDKLLPGWSHFAQFTIAVVNKDPKKSKYSGQLNMRDPFTNDTLHRFWKKEHDWGWKKFMELSKVFDGFIVADALVIKAQVQVIREKAHRPFRCLDCQYRRELVRVYLSNVEQICRRFFEERRGKLSKLIDDKVRWSSFRAFWLGIDPNARRHMSRDKTDAILKVVVKHFFIEKEVTSTLVMDSLYSGLRALECPSKNKKGRAQLIDLEELPAPMVRIDKDMFVLVDDVLLLLERAVLEPFPHQPLPPKDDKSTQSRTKDGSSGEEFNKDSIECDEWRLSELGRRMVEIFVLAHIFSSRIEVAYQEAVALKRQEELIREEEAAGQVENDVRAKRGAAEKEKRAKKKQGKQKRNNRKGKDRGRDEKSDAIMWERVQQQSPSDERGLDDFPSKQMDLVIEKIDTLEDASDVSENGDFAADVLQPDLDDRDNSTVNWDTDTSEIQPPRGTNSGIQDGQTEKRNPSVMDDSSSTCSTYSVPSVVMNGPNRGNTLLNKSQTSPSRVKNQRSKEIHERTVFSHGGNNPPSNTAVDAGRSCDVSSSRSPQPESEAVERTLKDQIYWLEQNLVEKEEVVTQQKKVNVKDQVDVERPSNTRTAGSSSSSSPRKKPPYMLQQPKQLSETTAMASATTASTMTMAEPVCSREPPSSSTPQSDKPVPPASRSPKVSSISKSEASRHSIQAKSTNSQVTAMSRPSSAPLIPAARPTAPIISTIQTVPLLSRSVSAAGRLGADPFPSAPSYIPQSYRSAIMGKTTMGASPAGFAHHPTSSGQGVGYSQAPSALVPSASVLPPQNSARKDQGSAKPGLIFGSVKLEAPHGQPPWKDDCSRPEPSSCGGQSSSNVGSDIERLDIYGEMQAKHFASAIPSGANSYQGQGVVADEFPHLDIINDLLDEEQSNGKAAKGLHHNHHHSFSRQYSFPGNASAGEFGSLNGSCRFGQTEQYGDESFQRVYGSSNCSVHGLREGHFSQVDLSAYANGQIDGVMQNQWLYGCTDLSMLNLGTGDANGYSYEFPEYSNLADGVNGYMYRPANGP